MIHELGQNQYLVSGEISVIDSNTIEITELPVRTWTQVRFGVVRRPGVELWPPRLNPPAVCSLWLPCAGLQGVCAGAHAAGH